MGDIQTHLVQLHPGRRPVRDEGEGARGREAEREARGPRRHER